MESGGLGARTLKGFEMPISPGWEEAGRHFYNINTSLSLWVNQGPSPWELAPLSLLEPFLSYDLHCVFSKFLLVF